MAQHVDRKNGMYMTARQVCAALDIQAATLYSYVSRGWIRSEETNSKRRERRYMAEDVARLIAKKQNRRDPDVTAARAARESLKWGVPVLESALTLIQAGRLYYRGHDVIALARERTFEEVVGVLWENPSPLSQGGEKTNRHDDVPAPDEYAGRYASSSTAIFTQGRKLAVIPPPMGEMGGRFNVIDRMINTLTDIDAAQSLPVEIQAARMVWSLALTAGTPSLNAMTLREWIFQDMIAPHERIAEFLARLWGVDDPRLIDATLILCADHELNASAFAVRVAASTDADLPHALIAGLATLSGGKHGGATAHTRRLIEHVGTSENTRGTITTLLSRGERVPGFGHHLYPDGDPRGRALLEILRETVGDVPVMGVVDAICNAMLDLTGQYPNIDMALSALELAAELPELSALALFALGRSAGWIAHAMEQHADGNLIRPRAAYVGIEPRG